MLSTTSLRTKAANRLRLGLLDERSSAPKVIVSTLLTCRVHLVTILRGRALNCRAAAVRVNFSLNARPLRLGAHQVLMSRLGSSRLAAWTHKRFPSRAQDNSLD